MFRKLFINIAFKIKSERYLKIYFIAQTTIKINNNDIKLKLS
jgi:hypothetical protein